MFTNEIFQETIRSIKDGSTQMKKKTVFSSLDDIAPKAEDRVPLSTRVKKETRKFLNDEAKARKIKLSALTAAILDQYVEQIRNQGK